MESHLKNANGGSSIFYRDAGKTEEVAVAMAGEDEMGEEKLRPGWGAQEEYLFDD